MFCVLISLSSLQNHDTSKRTPIRAGYPSPLLTGEENDVQLEMPWCDTGAVRGGALV